MTKRLKHIFMGVSALALVSAVSAPAFAADVFELTILHTNDFHSRIEPINQYDATCDPEDNDAGKCFGGAARLETVIQERRAASPNTLLLDGGDQFQGSLFYTYYKGKAAAEFMNTLGYDAMVVGNHEFDDGPEVLRGFMDVVDFPVLSENTEASQDEHLADVLTGSFVKEIGGERVGIIGLTREDTDELSSPGENISFEDPVTSMSNAVEAMEAQGVNKIIILSHSGFSVDKEVAANVAGIDVIVGGHSNTYLSNTSEEAQGPYPTWVEGPDGRRTAIVQAYAYGKYLGELNVKFDENGDVIEASGEPVLIDATYPENEQVKERIEELAEPLQEIRETVVGSLSAPLDVQSGVCRHLECEMGNLVADAMLERVQDQGVDFAIMNGGGMRASLAQGEVTLGEVYDVLPFQDTYTTFNLKGEYVVEALENGVSQLETGAGRFPQVSGLHYTFDPRNPVGERVTSVSLADGTPLDNDGTYKVVSRNYMVEGGDGYEVFKNEATNSYGFGTGLEVVVSDYLENQQGPYEPYLDGRIQMSSE